jgi:hypothetical protein
MTEGPAQEWRRERMRALAKKMHGNAALGRALGWRDGAYVGQMIAGMRPITEKVIEKAESLPGARGWFTREAAKAPASSTVFDELTEEEKAFLMDYRQLTDTERERYTREIAARAAELRAYLAKAGVLPFKPTAPVTPEAKKHAKT